MQYKLLKYFLLSLVFALSVAISAAVLQNTSAESLNTSQDKKVFDAERCTCNGIPLRGKVKVVTAFADFNVQVVSAFPDIKVKKVEHFPDECGKWQFVDNFPDFTIQYVENFPDFKVQFVENFP
jgi:hypothetical protein